ncbi:MAG: hypothetical protein EOP24_39940 [Hyphomicrobiales bacterium]|nr:MAG: hypothetical protein EOP24_39940 [Hyphomicrobiales bacterium]
MFSSILLCLVVGVSDGDTLKARCGQPGAYEQVTVRLAEIDAPEKSQPFGQRSKEHLSGLCFGKQAKIRPSTRDRYGRTVARVTCAGADANVEQVSAGMAWAYTRYQTDPKFTQHEQQARATRAGLWRDAKPVAPWEWRADRRQARQRS